MTRTVTQARFRAALLDPSAATPAGLTDPEGATAPKRFAVYRNNVAVSLTEALMDGFPVVARLVGDAFFKAMAGVFLRAHPPTSPILARWGDAFPGFLEGFGPAARLPYLPDTARLELALHRAYHAADAAPLDPARLGALSPEALMAARLRFAPAVSVLSSPHPVHAIWAANARGGPAPAPGPQEVLVGRPGFDPVALPLPEGGAAATRALMAGAPLGDAAAGTDLTALLTAWLRAGALTGLEIRACRPSSPTPATA
ncbi:MAG: HvfC/BufC N-terminal domain-containing protein [Hasllibacter sp.]